MKVDFHVHTTASIDGFIAVADLAKRSKKFGIIPALTDHNTGASWEKMKSARVPFIAGEEISTTAGDFIGLFLTEAIPKKVSAEEAADRIKQQGGLSYLPHMYDRTRKGCGSKYADLADIIEVFNARCLTPFNKQAEQTAAALKKPRAAGSDSHFLFEFGSTYTSLPAFDLDNPKSLLKALKSRAVKLTCQPAPFYVRGTTWLLSKGKKMWRSVNG
ncbi:MAG: PHP-associated domain-containing protein [Candidatus Micrarchaeota archaeon]